MHFAIIDLSNMFFRSIAGAGRHADAFTKAGMALHITFQMLRKLHREIQCDHMVFCAEGHSWRYELFPEYKLRRKLNRLERTEREKEEDEVCFSVLQDFTTFISEKTRCTFLQRQGVEADDFVARFIQLHPGDRHTILSSDSDFLQILAPNVQIIDGVNERIITLDGVTNFKGEDLVFSVDSSSGKLKIAGTVNDCRKAHDKDQTAKFKNDPSYQKLPYDWAPPSRDSEWWKEALFIKIIRGDAGDGIFSSYPKVRYKGTTKATGIREAWEDRNTGGFHWNNFMLQKWSKLVNENGVSVTKDVRVLDEFKFNETLIDLTRQPDFVKDQMDEAIIEAAQKQPVGNVGLALLKFCHKQNLPVVAKDATDHARYLNAGYFK